MLNLLNQKLLALAFCGVMAVSITSRPVSAQTIVPPSEKKNEAAFLVGVNQIADRSTSLGKLSFDRGLHYQAVYARDIWGVRWLHFFLEAPVIYTPQVKINKSSPGDPAASYSNFLFIPGVRAKFFPRRWYSPWLSAGYGYSTSSASGHLLDGAVNNQTRTASGKAWQYGGGIDFKVTSRFSVRAETRDFYTVVPALALPQNDSRNRNLLYSAGIVFHF